MSCIFSPAHICRRPTGGTWAAINARSRALVSRDAACHTALSGSAETAAANTLLTEELLDKFRAADIDGNGYIDREEFGRLAESTAGGLECAMFHWLDDHTVEALFAKYARDSDDVKAITFESFRRLAEDGVLLEGRLAEYRDLFQRCNSYREEDGTIFGSIDREDVEGLLSMLEHPLNADEAGDLLDGFCTERQCGDERGNHRISFQEFLNLFRGHLLDLQQITEYLKLEELPLPNVSDDELREAQKHAGEISKPEKGVFQVLRLCSCLLFVAGMPCLATHGVHVCLEVYELGVQVESSEQFDSLVKLHPDKVVLLVAGLSWCRPCKSLTRPLQKIASHYEEGAIVVKVLGDTNDNTKRFFKNKLKVKATPHLSFWRKGTLAHSRTGANKTKLEDGIRRFYCRDMYSLPNESLYPMKSK